jgi:predicted GTPase
VVDALRPDDARGLYPGEAVLRTADIIVVNKVNSARAGDVERAEQVARSVNPRAPIVRGALLVSFDAAAVRGKRVVVVEDGPTITHGSMPFGAGFVAASAAEPAAIVDPRSAAVGELRDVFLRHPHIGAVLPAIGYTPAQLAALTETLRRTDAEVVVAATPVDLARLIDIDKPVVRVRYDFAEAGEPGLGALVDRWLAAGAAC